MIFHNIKFWLKTLATPPFFDGFTAIKFLGYNLSSKREGFIVVGLALLVTLLRLPSLEQPFDNDSAANAYHARLITRGEPLYGSHHPTHHMPAVYYVYALAFFVFGDSVWAVKFFLLLWTVVTVYVLYLLGRLLADSTTGLLAAIFYAVLTAHLWLLGMTAEIELFANLPRIAAVLVLLHLTAQQASAWKYGIVGILSAISFLFKPVYLSPLGLAGFILAVELWQNRENGGFWQEILKRGVWIGLGFAAGLLPVLVYFDSLGLLPRFMLVFTLGRDYVSFRSMTSGTESGFWALYPIFGLAINNVVLLLFSLVGLLIIFARKLRKLDFAPNDRSTMIFFVAVWYLLSFVEAGITRTLFLHYYLLIVPPLALVAAWILLQIYHQIRLRRPLIAILFLALSLSLASLISISQNFNYYYHYWQYKVGVESYQDFILKGWPETGVELVRVQALADYIRNHTSLSGRVYYWSGNVQLYYLTDRRAPIAAIWPLYAEAFGAPQQIFRTETKYVIVGESNNRPHPDWLRTELAKAYVLEKTIGDEKIFRRLDSKP